MLVLLLADATHLLARQLKRLKTMHYPRQTAGGAAYLRRPTLSFFFSKMTRTGIKELSL